MPASDAPASDLPAEDVLTRLLRTATRVTGAPVGLVSVVGADRDVWLAAVGVPDPAVRHGAQVSRPSFCSAVVAAGAPLVVPDAAADPRVAAFPAVAAYGVRAYLGAPLVGADGQTAGSFCVFATEPRAWSAEDQATVADLAAAAAAELARHAEAAALRDVLEGSLDAAYLLACVRDGAGRAADFKIVDCNAHAGALVGLAREALVGRTWHSLFATRQARVMFAAYARVADTGAPLEVEFETTDPRLAARWLRVQATRVGDGVALAVRDVTERKAADAALRASEARHRALVETLPVVVYQVQPEPPYAPLYVSPGAAAYGYAPAEWLATPDLWVRLLHPDDRARVLAETRAALVAGRAVDYEYRLMTRGGEVRWVHDRGDFVRDDAGRVVAWQGLMLDVTARKVAETAHSAAEAAVAAREARFRALIEHAREVVGVLAADGTILYESPAVARVLGYSPEAMMGQPAFAFVHPDDAPAVAAQLERLLASAGAAEPVTYRCRHADGSWRTLEGDAWNLVDHPAVGGVVVNVRDVTRRRALEAELRRQATHDALTGLANREEFRARVSAALAAAAAAPEQVAVLFLDLDDFKAVNDTLGHAQGDALLREAARRLLGATRGSDTVARLGGDEFAVLIEHVAGDADARCVADRITGALAAPYVLGAGPAAREVFAPASVGIARARPGDAADDALRNADLAMYRAKALGKGGVAVFAPDMHAALLDRVALAADLRRAVDALAAGACEAAGEFALAFQPVVALGTGRVTGAEALLRWRHPARGLVSPAEFVPLAEETGVIVPLGRWVLREACRQAARWRGAAAGAAALAGAFGVSVNVSARQLQEPAFVGDVARALADAGLPPGALVVELTEGVLVRDADTALARFAALKALGVRIAIDDFGTGYSSLAYLQRFPVDVLKLDRAFVAGVARGGPGAALARAVVALGDALGLRTVAEGIETAEQRERLRALGCALGQGYLFARPMPAEAFAEALLAEAALGDAAGEPALSTASGTGPAPSA